MYTETSISSSASWAKVVGNLRDAEVVGGKALGVVSGPFGSQRNCALTPPLNGAVVVLCVKLPGFKDDTADLRERLLLSDGTCL